MLPCLTGTYSSDLGFANIVAFRKFGIRNTIVTHLMGHCQTEILDRCAG